MHLKFPDAWNRVRRLWMQVRLNAALYTQLHIAKHSSWEGEEEENLSPGSVTCMFCWTTVGMAL